MHVLFDNPSWRGALTVMFFVSVAAVTEGTYRFVEHKLIETSKAPTESSKPLARTPVEQPDKPRGTITNGYTKPGTIVDGYTKPGTFADGYTRSGTITDGHLGYVDSYGPSLGYIETLGSKRPKR
jgi:hypothetical protein